MPGMDGFQFLESLRGLGLERKTPVVVWTVKDLTSEESSLLHNHVSAVVTCSADGAAVLVEAIRHQLAPAAAKGGVHG